eukprot:6008794-Pleurochrysis_carterae.AAC.1
MWYDATSNSIRRRAFSRIASMCTVFAVTLTCRAETVKRVFTKQRLYEGRLRAYGFDVNVSSTYRSRNASKLVFLMGRKKEKSKSTTASGIQKIKQERWIRVPLTIWANHSKWMSWFYVDTQQRLVGRVGGVHEDTDMRTVRFISCNGRLLPPDEWLLSAKDSLRFKSSPPYWFS